MGAERKEVEHEYRLQVHKEGGERGALESSSSSLRDVEMTIREIDDSQLVGAPVTVAEELVVGRLGAGGGDVCMVDVEVRSCEVGVAKMLTSAAGDVTGKRKRGRPLRGRPRVAPPPSQQRQKQDEEDVCFICFDGGSLVLCDRRGCPKAYHPACIKRDEAFFRSKAKWNCGWHICSTCQKASHYMCYTCTYSLCKRCTKNADYLCVRENKGFCGTCMRTVMLIEKIAVGHNEMIQADFDDKTSWEYLFKVYWICLKNKLSLTLDELIKAKNPWNVDELPKARNLWRGTNAMAPKGIPISELHHCNDEKGSKVNNQPVLVDKGNSVVIESSALDKTAYLALEGTVWATKELMEFIAHMKNGDVSVLSQFDVQALLLEYIKRNKLRDPRQKSLIVCDSRLISLFGKARVGHFEMLNLLKCHFLIKEKPSVEETVRAEAAENNGTQVIVNNDRRRKPRRKTDEGGALINANPDECAAIDVHNINLLYLKRSLVENLLDDAEKFPEKVVGSFVRIKISGGDQKIEAYRLVQVVGTTKVAESYTVGTRMTDFMLEILNLDKKEIVSIDGISNQEFSEDECRHLRQSTKCGLNKRLTVGEILGKAMMLLAVKVGDGLEAEKLLLNHLCDRASEKGQRKQLRDCAEKLELLKSPKELQQRLLEIPKIHADPKLDPSYESDEYPREAVGKKPGGHARPRNSGRGRKGIQAHSMLSSNISSDTGNRGHSSNSQKTKVGVSAQITSEQNIQSVVQSETSSGIASAILPPTASTGVEIFANDIENERLWHYQDPTGKVQGPFAMRLLRRWSLNGLFPLDLRVWKINKQDDSVLLTDALVGRLHKEPALPQEVFGASTNNDKGWENGLYMDQSTDTTWADSKNVESSSKSAQSCANFCDNSNSELMSTIFGSDSPSWTTSVTVTPLENGQVQSSVHGLDASKSSKSWTDQPQKCSNSSSPPSAGKFRETPSPQVRKDHGDEKLSTDLGDVKDDFIRTAEGQSNLVANEEKRAESEVYSSHSPGQNWGPLALNSSSSSGWASNSGIVSESKSVEKLKQHKEIDFSDLPRPTPKFSEEGIKGQPAESKPPASSSVPTLDSGPSWSTASSLVVGGAQLPEVVGEWYGYSSASTKPSVDEWDSNVVPASSLKPATEVASDHVATPTSGSVQLTQCSETHLTIDADDWQPIVTEGPENEFSLVDESVSDLLAEVEAMESMGGLSSPTSRMNCSGELTQGSDNNCFAPVEEFSPVPDQGKNDALSSTGDMQMPSHLAVAHEQPPQLSHMPSQPAVSEALVIPQMPSQLHLANEPLRVSHLPSQATLVDELGTSHMHCQSNVTNGPVELPQTDAFDPHKSFGAPSSNSAEVDRDTKPVDGSGNQWDSASEVQPLESSHFPQGKTGLDGHQSAESQTDAYLGSTKVNANLNRGLATKGTANMIWGGPGHGTVQHQASLNTTNSIENPGSWGSHNPRYGGERSSGARDQRNYYQGRDSGFGRDSRSTWNRQPLNGGHTFRAPPKGQRVCKYYESGYCRKGASCSYWHPGA